MTRVALTAIILALLGDEAIARCHPVKSDSGHGHSFGKVVAGQTYFYVTDFLASFDCDHGLYVDADGYPHGGEVADENYVCPGLKTLSMVGRIRDTCVQMGVAGTFVAPETGRLQVGMNDAIGSFKNNCRFWKVCVIPVPTNACVTVSAIESNGVSAGSVVLGHRYLIFAPGKASYSCAGPLEVDADGVPFGGVVADSNYACPGLRTLSMVGKINGTLCVQLGSRLEFTAPVSGELRLFMNDTIDGFSDNCGAWDVCIIPIF